MYRRKLRKGVNTKKTRINVYSYVWNNGIMEVMEKECNNVFYYVSSFLCVLSVCQYIY